MGLSFIVGWCLNALAVNGIDREVYRVAERIIAVIYIVISVIWSSSSMQGMTPFLLAIAPSVAPSWLMVAVGCVV